MAWSSGSGTDLALANHKHSIGANVIDNTMMKDDAINTDEIVNGAVTTDKLDANAVTNAKLAASGLDAGKLQLVRWIVLPSLSVICRSCNS